MLGAERSRKRREAGTITRQDFNDAIDRFGDMVTRVLLLRCRNPMDAEDCFQNVFLKLLLDKTEFRDDEHCKAWLLRTAMNEAADRNRRVWRRRVVLLGDTPLPEAVTMPQETVGLLDALRSLPRRWQEVLFLHCCEGYSVAETAALLDIPPGTVKSRLSRGREALRELLKEEP